MWFEIMRLQVLNIDLLSISRDPHIHTDSRRFLHLDLHPKFAVVSSLSLSLSLSFWAAFSKNNLIQAVTNDTWFVQIWRYQNIFYTSQGKMRRNFFYPSLGSVPPLNLIPLLFLLHRTVGNIFKAVCLLISQHRKPRCVFDLAYSTATIGLPFILPSIAAGL